MPAWVALTIPAAGVLLLIAAWLLVAYTRWRRRSERLRWERRQAWLERQAEHDRRRRLGLEDNL